MKRFWPIFLLAILPLIPLWPAVFGGQSIGPFDQIHQMAPWNGPKPEQPWDVLQADGVLQFYPWRDMVFKAWGSGHLPLWNPYELAGTPLLGNSQSAGFYPPHVVLGLLHFPTGTAMTLLAWFHLFWAGLGTYLLTRRFGATKLGAAVSGASFQLSAFMIAWTGLPSVITTCSWIPWLLAGIAGVFQSRAPWAETENDAGAEGRRAARVQTRWGLLVALSAGMMFLAGHLQFAAYGCFAAGLLAVWLLFDSRRHLQTEAEAGRETGLGVATETKPARTVDIASGVRVLLSVAFGFALAAPQLLPVLNYSQYSHRRGPATDIGYEGYSASALKPFELVGLVYPKLAGDPASWVPDIDSSDRLSAYWPQYVKRGANFAESASAIGPVVLLLLCTLPFRRPNWRRLAPLFAIGLLGLLLAMGTFLTRFTYFYIPGWSSTGSPGRAIVLFVLAACVIAGMAVQEQPATAGPVKLKELAPAGAFLVLSLLFVAAVKGMLSGLGSFYPGLEESIGSIVQLSVREPLKIAMLSTLITAIAGAAWLVKGGRSAWVLPLLAGLSPVLLVGGVVRFGDPASLLVDVHPAGRVAIVNSDWDIPAAAPALLPPNLASLSGIHELAGYDSLLHRETKKMLDNVNGGADSAPPANGNMMFIKPKADPSELAQAGVSEVWSRKELPQLGTPEPSQGFFRYAIQGPGRASSPAGPATVTTESPSSITLHATGPGRLTLRDRNMPGWIAKVDGRHVPIEGSVWREVDLPAGDHTVEFNYIAPGMMNGIFAGIPAWILLIGLAAISRRDQFKVK